MALKPSQFDDLLVVDITLRTHALLSFLTTSPYFDYYDHFRNDDLLITAIERSELRYMLSLSAS